MKKFPLWNKIKGKTKLLSIDLEITARCNNNCRHCYINLPEGDKAAREKELSLQEIEEIADEARSLGALECLITGGEPLLREDFFDIYLCLKKMGLLVSVFTNATLITREHARFFKQYPPRDMEVSVYGVTDVTYERITRRKGSFSAFQRGLGLLLDSGVKVRLKAMALRSNAHELQNMARFCRQKTKDYYRFDPLLHLRYDRNPQRNTEIRGERLSAEEIVALERSDPERFRALEKNCDNLIFPKNSHSGCNHLFLCGAGTLNCVIGYDGQFRLCYSLWHPDCIYDLRAGSLRDAFLNLVPNVRDLQSSRKEYHDKCRVCPIINLCLWCPAHALLETGEMDTPVDYFCEVAHARADMLKKA